MIGLSRTNVSRTWKKVLMASAMAVTLSTVTPTAETATFTIPRLASEIKVRIKRPTTLAPLVWDDTGKIRVTISVFIDGEEHKCVGGTSGGVRTDKLGAEMPEYVLTYKLQRRLVDGAARRIGELATAAPTAKVLLEYISGVTNTEIIIAEVIEAPRPQWVSHNSVAFDAATDAQELGGDETVSLTHTAGGSDRGIFVGAGNSGGIPRAGSASYGGTTLTELWDATFGSFFGHAGYHYPNGGTAPTGAQTVSYVMAGTADEHALGVVSMTGVHQTTAVGTANTAVGASTTATVTVASVGADDLVCANLYSGWLGATPGTDETERYEEQMSGAVTLACTTQPGSAGGVMTMTRTAAGFATDWGIGAVAFKPAAAGGGGINVVPLLMAQRRMRVAA